jgi:hypothetical protein
MSNLEQRFADTSPAYAEPHLFNTDPREQPQWPNGQPPFTARPPQQKSHPLRWLGVSVIILVVVFGGLVSANLLLRHTVTETKTFAVGSTPTLVVNNSNGDVHITNGSTNQITVVARKQVFLGDSNQLPVHYDLSSDQQTLTISVDDSISFGWFNWNQGVDFDVTVPDQAGLNVHTGNGNLEATGITGQIKLDTGNGNIQASGLDGALTLHSGNGDITARQTNASGTSTFKTGNGSIDYQGTLEATNGSYLFTTGNGDIDLTLPANASFQVSYETGNGSTDSDFALGSDGKVGNGPYAQVTLHSGNGSIHLHQGN